MLDYNGNPIPPVENLNKCKFGINRIGGHCVTHSRNKKLSCALCSYYIPKKERGIEISTTDES